MQAGLQQTSKGVLPKKGGRALAAHGGYRFHDHIAIYIWWTRKSKYLRHKFKQMEKEV